MLAIVEALRGYFLARRHEGLSRDALARRWYEEQLIRPSRDHVERALRFMNKTRDGDRRVAPPPRAR